MKHQELVDIFNFEDDVAAYIAAKVKEMVTKERHDFSLSGSNHTGFCAKGSAPHVPHRLGSYNTVRYGQLEYYCLGVEGETPEGHIHIVVEKRSPGDPASPSRARGYFFCRNPGQKKEEEKWNAK